MKVSVIVPVYNVDRYLNNCVNSLLVQTYENIEIILVDDGSTDGSSEICDSYSMKDSRIKVIHKKNGGLSDARNKGLDIASGQWVTFVDSDDYVTKDYVETLLSLLTVNNADISIATYTFVTEKKYQSRGTGELAIMTPEVAIKRLLMDDGFDMGAWAKMYRIEYFDKIRFPKGKLFEDSLVTCQIFAEANKVVFESKSVYFYVNRKESITNAKFTKRKLNLIEMTDKAAEFIIRNYPGLRPYVQRRILWSRFSTLNQILTSSNRKEHQEISHKLKEEILSKKELIRSNIIPKRDKIGYWILKLFGLTGYRICWNFYLIIMK